jgi:hypothetical protein
MHLGLSAETKAAILWARVVFADPGSCTTATARGNILQIDTTGTAGPVRLYSCTTTTARGYLVQIDNTAALSHQSQYIGRPTGTAGPVRLYSCSGAAAWSLCDTTP